MKCSTSASARAIVDAGLKTEHSSILKEKNQLRKIKKCLKYQNKLWKKPNLKGVLKQTGETWLGHLLDHNQFC